jgi:hypothetical protein
VNGDKDGYPQSFASGVASPALVDGLLAYAVAMAIEVAVFTVEHRPYPTTFMINSCGYQCAGNQMRLGLGFL